MTSPRVDVPAVFEGYENALWASVFVVGDTYGVLAAPACLLIALSLGPASFERFVRRTGTRFNALLQSAGGETHHVEE